MRNLLAVVAGVVVAVVVIYSTLDVRGYRGLSQVADQLTRSAHLPDPPEGPRQ